MCIWHPTVHNKIIVKRRITVPRRAARQVLKAQEVISRSLKEWMEALVEQRQIPLSWRLVVRKMASPRRVMVNELAEGSHGQRFNMRTRPLP